MPSALLAPAIDESTSRSLVEGEDCGNGGTPSSSSSAASVAILLAPSGKICPLLVHERGTLLSRTNNAHGNRLREGRLGVADESAGASGRAEMGGRRRLTAPLSGPAPSQRARTYRICGLASFQRVAEARAKGEHGRDGAPSLMSSAAAIPLRNVSRAITTPPAASRLNTAPAALAVVTESASQGVVVDLVYALRRRRPLISLGAPVMALCSPAALAKCSTVGVGRVVGVGQSRPRGTGKALDSRRGSVGRVIGVGTWAESAV
ncbi:hypothetical protein BJ912DRAFT_1148828 [Pholiota molesta]|nr:hypothetical protein BJ912DRAFT_1148828 [Pholiota molesta]